VVIYVVELMRRSTAMEIYMTEDRIFDSAGRELARFEDIKKVDRSFFAFKPSNGFLLITTKKAPRVWAPGLWWRLGRYVGVGGITPAAQTKSMAEILAFRIAQRDQAPA